MGGSVATLSEAAMGKSKKAQNLTHEEIWDDSALVRSWDEAVEEYQLYHSIHAKGENVEDVLKEAERAGLAEEANDPDEAEMVVDDEARQAEGEASEHHIQETAKVTPRVASSAAAPSQSAPGGPGSATPAGNLPASAMPMPEPALSHVQDENLKRLMMSWYFAGYYTGLYEGQQQAGQGKTA